MIKNPEQREGMSPSRDITDEFFNMSNSEFAEFVTSLGNDPIHLIVDQSTLSPELNFRLRNLYRIRSSGFKIIGPENK